MLSLSAEKSKQYKEFVFRRVINISLVILFFLISSNRLFPIPIDKVTLPFFIAAVLLVAGGTFSLLKTEFLSLIIFMISCMLSIAANITSFSPIIVFPALGLLFGFVVSKNVRTLLLLYQSLLIHIILGIVLWVASYTQGMNDYVSSMGAKGLPFLHEAKGFTATVQTFGTLCISWLLLYELKKKETGIGRWDKFFYNIVTIAILITFNRATYLAYFAYLFFTHKKLLIFYCLLLSVFVIYFIDSIMLLFLNVTSLDARSDLLEGFEKSYLDSHSILIWLFGRGNNSIPANILQNVTIYYRSDIENGHAMLLHTYGLFGYVLYITGSLYFTISTFLKRRDYFFTCFCILYLVLLPYITQEYMSTTLYIFLCVIFFRGKQLKSRYSIKDSLN